MQPVADTLFGTAGAEISDCGRYRYRLWRSWGDGPRLPFVMLNPSTADADQDDPTIRRCVGFARRESYVGIEVVNLFAWRATDPKDLADTPDDIIFGFPRNVDVLERLMADHPVVVAAWGARFAEVVRRQKTLSYQRPDIRGFVPNADYGVSDHPKMIQAMANQNDTQLVCLGVTADRSPRHPLMVRSDQRLIPWEYPR